MTNSTQMTETGIQRLSGCGKILVAVTVNIKLKRQISLIGIICSCRDWFSNSKRVSFVTMKVHYCFTISKSKWMFPLLLLLGGCAHQTVEPGLAEQSEGNSHSDATGQIEGEAKLDPTDPEVMFRVFSGEVLGSGGDMELAAGEYLEAAMESDDPEIAERATRVAMAAQAWQYAAMASDRWVVLQPESIDARQTAARTMMIVGDYVAAEHHFNGILSQMSHDSGRAWALVSGLLTTATNIEKAGQILDRLIEENNAQNNPDAHFAKSQFLALIGNLEEAQKLAELVIELAPERAEFHAWAGRIAVNLQQEVIAIDYYHTAWELQPNSQPIAMAYAQLLKRNDEIDAAQEVLAGLEDSPINRFARIAFALDSELQPLAEEIYAGFKTAQYADEMAHGFQAGQAAELLQLEQEAADWYELVVRGNNALIAALRRAYLTAQNGDLDSARKQLAKLRLQHDTAIVKESYLAESEILVSAGMGTESFELLSNALELMPEDSQLLYGRAMIAVQLDRIADAELDLRKIIELDPQNAAALNALGYTLADRVGRYDEAEKLIRSAYSLQPEEASIIDSMGWVAYRQGRLDEAEKFLREALTRDNNPEIAAHLGEVLWVNHDSEEALHIWNTALQTDPGNEVIIETMQRLGAVP
jgi:tetratricopeptide (TPR) repeat protein